MQQWLDKSISENSNPTGHVSSPNSDASSFYRSPDVVANADGEGVAVFTTQQSGCLQPVSLADLLMTVSSSGTEVEAVVPTIITDSPHLESTQNTTIQLPGGQLRYVIYCCHVAYRY